MWACLNGKCELLTYVQGCAEEESAVKVQTASRQAGDYNAKRLPRQRTLERAAQSRQHLLEFHVFKPASARERTAEGRRREHVQATLF